MVCILTECEQKEANAKLIADAGTTINKCNLLPSELLSQMNEMLEIMERVQRINNIAREHISEFLFEDIEQLIKKATL